MAIRLLSTDTGEFVISHHHDGYKKTITVDPRKKRIDRTRFMLDLQSWSSGIPIQKALPYLSPSEREFIISGTSEDEWEAMFSEEEK